MREVMRARSRASSASTDDVMHVTLDARERHTGRAKLLTRWGRGRGKDLDQHLRILVAVDPRLREHVLGEGRRVREVE